MNFAVKLWAGLVILSGCRDKEAPPDDSAPTETLCAEAEARLGFRACEHRVPDEDAVESLSIRASTADQLRVGKYLVPAREDARLPGVFLDVNNFQLHHDFLVEAFPELFAGLGTTEYQSLILYPETREFYAGTWGVYVDDGEVFYGFTVWDDPVDASSTLTQAQVTAAWTELSARFLAGELVWVPNSSNQMAAALGWTDAPFEIANPADIEYEAYNVGEAYGYLRLYTPEQFAQATVDASFGYQDIVVIEEAPEDIERVVSGMVTGTRQGALSHLAVRSAGRGTPNCFIAEPLANLAAWQDQMVRLECGETTYTVEAATVEEASAWWEALRPDPLEICAPNLDTYGLPGLLELATDTAEQRAGNICTYGAKGSNLGALYQRIDPQYQLSGFVIPFAYYQDFVDTGTWVVDLGEGPATHTFSETLSAWHQDAAFLSDAALRRERLDALRAAMQAAPVDPAVVQALGEQIRAVWGGDTTMVRFRSSSNAEDGAGFSGAGLYDSRSVCYADDLDGDAVGPSLCDPNHDDERSVEDGIRRVWASLWKVSAWEERSWYGIDPGLVAMGVLADDRSVDEQANIVAFSGNPSTVGDGRYLVNAQEGELEVVSAEAGVYPEKVLLTLSGGAVSQIDRVSPSSEVDEVLTDAELEELGAVLFEVAQLYPIDDEIPAGHDLVWDTEWKILSDGRLIIKQIRPFIR